MTPSPTAMPIAVTGPRLLMEASSATSKHSRLSTMVEGLAVMAGPARWSASAIASWRSALRRNSSR
jgi:hypothetical protein